MNKPQQLDIEHILRSRIPKRYSRFIPSPFYRGLERLIHQDLLNEVLSRAYPAEGCEFARRALEILGVTVESYGLDPIPVRGRYVFASNHPLGGLDGLALLDVVGRKFGDHLVHFPVNDMLMNVEPLRSVFLPVNKYGAQGRDGAERLNNAYAGTGQILIFPAGLVSRIDDDGKIADLEWKKGFAAKALEYGRQIVPVRIEAQNRPIFYKAAQWRKALRIGVNLEQVLLPGELAASRGMTIRIIFGKPQNMKMLADAFPDPRRMARHIRDLSNHLKIDRSASEAES